jgi:hypothetical protein
MIEIPIDNPRSRRRLRKIIERRDDQVDLRDIVLVGETLTDDTVATLPSTFPSGDGFHGRYIKTKEGLGQGLSQAEISRIHNIPTHSVTSYANGIVPRSTQSVKVAQKEGILPFSLTNPHINSFNAVFALAFWTGCLGQGMAQVKSNKRTQSAVQRIVESLGYTEYDETIPNENDAGNRNYVLTRDTSKFVLCSSALSRSFAALGLPFMDGDKPGIEDFDFPWYLDLLRGKFLDDFQELDEGSKDSVRSANDIFAYALLSDRTNSANMRNGMSVDLMATHSERVGKRFTHKVADLLNDTFPYLDLTERNLLTTERIRTDRPSPSFRNKIYFYGAQVEPLLGHLAAEAYAHRVDFRLDPNTELYPQVRSISGDLLAAKVLRK